MIQPNTTLAGFPFSLVNKASGAAVTSGTTTGYVLRDGGTQATLAGTCTHEGNGQWSIDSITAAEINGTVVGLLFVNTSAVSQHFTIFTANEPRRGIAITGFPFLMVDTAGEAITTGTVTGYRLLDGGTQTALAGSCTHEGNGQWSVNLTAAETDAKTIGLLFVHSSGVNVSFTIPTVNASSVLGASGAAGTPTIKTGLSTFWPMCFAKSRNNHLIGVNGIDRGIRWDGITTATEDLGIDAPTVAPTVTTPTGGAATAGDYICGYRYIDDELPVPTPSSISPVAEVTAVGLDQFTWADIAASAQTRVVKVELWRSTMGQATTVYKVATLGHNGTITSSANSSGLTFTTPSPHNLAVGAVITVAGHSVPGYNTSHTVSAVTSLTFKTGVAYSSDGTGGTWQLTGYSADTSSDTTLQALDADDQMRMLTPRGDLNARRFVPPPYTKPYAAFFQDRLWMAGVVPYTLGTISTTAGSTTVTGSGTSWPSTLDGRYMAIQGESSIREIASVGSTTSITLEVAASASQTGVSYAIIPSPEERNQIYFSEIDEPESMSSLNVVSVQENTGDDDEITGLMPSGAYLYVLKTRHIYRLSCFAQPLLDVSITQVARRGCVNNRCWTRLNDTSYLMDEQGIYAFNGQSLEPISDPIRDLFRDGTIDWSKSKWFFAQADPVQEVIRFHVNYTTDTDNTRPIRWLEYHIRGGQWSTGSAVVEMGAACLAQVSNRLRVLKFSEGDVVYLFGQGICDHVTSATRGTATASTGTTLTDSTASFAATVVGAPVAITAGTGKGQIRRISARTSTQLTVSVAWDTNPDTTSQYLIGGIKWNMKTGLFTFTPSDEENKRDVRIVFQPTTGTSTLDVRRYINHSSSPENCLLSLDRGDGVTMVAGEPDAVMDLRLTRSDLEDASGYAQHKIPGRCDVDSMTDRFEAVELRGFQGDYEIKVYRVEILGVVGGES